MSAVDPYELLKKATQRLGGIDATRGESWPWPRGMELHLDKRVVAERGPLKREGNDAA